ncbi:MAG: RlmE family RNA methyltransferase [Planctomycetota bacterium]
MQRELHDHYFKQAKRDGYLSRAAYKLIEIDDKRGMLKRGMTVLDAGAAPGSWLQVISDRVGPKGTVIGVDLKAIQHQFRHDNVRTFEMDMRAMDVDVILEAIRPAQRFDAIMSDMAPNTTGDRIVDHHGSIRLCEALLDLAPTWLKVGGPLVMKVFEGEAYPTLMSRVQASFDRVRGAKPKASRSISNEMYIVATGYRGDAGESGDEQDDMPFELPKRKPSTGWGS